MPIYNTTIESVSSRVITTRDGRSSTVYEVIDGSGKKWSTFKQAIANEANKLLGQVVELTGRTETNDRGYENNYLDDVRLGTGAQQRAIQQQPEAPRDSYAPAERAIQAQQQQETPIQPAPIQEAPRGAWLDDKQWAIMRQAAAKVSAQLSDDPKSFWANLDPLLAYFAYGFMPQEIQQSNGDPHAREPVVPAGNQFIPESAYNDPGREAPVAYVDDIPFNKTINEFGG